MIRATTGGVMRGYRKNLMSSFIASNKARETMLTQRNFNSYAEAPADAARAFRLRMSRLTVNSQHKINEDAYYKYQGAFSCLDSVSKLVDTQNGGTQLQTLKSTTQKMLNDPTGDARTQLAKVLDEMSQTIVQTMNQKYGDSFIFAGADGYNVPFEVKSENGVNRLYYRGVPVDAAEPNVMKDATGEKFVRVVSGQVDINDPYGDNLPAGTPVNYLKMDNLTIISKDEYDKLYAMPNVELDANGQCKRYSKVDGEFQAIPPMDPDIAPPEDTTIYYQRLQADGTSFDPPQFITTDQYNEEVDRHNEPAAVLMGIDSGAANPTDPVIVEVDKDGVPTKNGGYYLLVDDKPQVISQEDYDTAKLNADKLDYMVNQEKRFVDIGLGFKENENGNLIESSGFNECLNGLTFLGYGMDEDGDPKNMYSIVQRLKEIAESVPDGQDWSDDTYNEFFGLVGKLEDAASNFKTEYTNMDAGTLKLKNNLDILEDSFYNLDEQTANLEDVNMVEAISSFIWAEYCYNAALKVGNSILSQSLMDYMS